MMMRMKGCFFRNASYSQRWGTVTSNAQCHQTVGDYSVSPCTRFCRPWVAIAASCCAVPLSGYRPTRQDDERANCQDAGPVRFAAAATCRTCFDMYRPPTSIRPRTTSSSVCRADCRRPDCCDCMLWSRVGIDASLLTAMFKLWMVKNTCTGRPRVERITGMFKVLHLLDCSHEL